MYTKNLPMESLKICGTNSKHALHLYAPNVDKYSIQNAFLIPSRANQRIIYVTGDDSSLLTEEFNHLSIQLKIINSSELYELNSEDNDLQLIIDAGSLANEKCAEIEKREGYLNELCRGSNLNCLCTYDLTKFNFEKIKQLATYHNELRLTTSDLTILSGDFFNESELSGKSVEKIVKDNLENVILAILQKDMMCGTEIIGTIHLKFNVLLSPGTIYPLLHSLEQKGLLAFKKSGKEIVYGPVEDAKPRIRNLVHEHIQAHSVLNHYLKQELEI
ncbi:MAG: PadR family transcriptional regulator [Candidatus Bathyarchaeia archaeon]